MKAVIRRAGGSHPGPTPEPAPVERKSAVALGGVRKNVRAGWAEASKDIAASGDDIPDWRAFGSSGDADLVW